MLSRPSVSVCIPTYNRAGFLKQAIHSVLTQSFEDFELIISDNASDDTTEAVVRSFDEPRIRYGRTSFNIGHRANWNRCLELSRGKFITILPDDDAMLRDNLESKVDVLSRNPGVGLVHSKFHVIDNDGRIIIHNTGKGKTAGRVGDAIDVGHEVLAAMLACNIICESTVLFRRECYERLGGFSSQVNFAFDWEYWMRITKHYDVGFVAKSLVKCRHHEGTLSSRLLRADLSTRISILRADLAAMRWILTTYLPSVPSGRSQLRKYVWEQMGTRVARWAEEMMGDGGPNRRARSSLMEMCRGYPEILIDANVWKALIKSVVSRRTVLILKRISPV